MINSAKQLFDAIGDKFSDQFPRLLLNGARDSGYRPSQSGVVETHAQDYLTLKTATAETKGMLAGCCFFLAIACVAMFFLTTLFGNPNEFTLWPLFAAVGFGVIPFLWELYRPFPLPIVFNRRTQEIYYDLNGKLYHAPWEGIEAVAYEYRNVNQYAGSMVQGNLEIILYRFGDSEDRIALNIGGHTSGKRIQTLASLWEYLRAYMNNGPWFDDLGKQIPVKGDFIKEQLKKSTYSSLDELKTAKKSYRREKAEAQGISGTAVFELISAYLFYPNAFMEHIVYKTSQRRSHKQWPDVVQERLKPDGPDTRLMDIEESYAAEQRKREEELQARVRARFPD